MYKSLPRIDGFDARFVALAKPVWYSDIEFTHVVLCRAAPIVLIGRREKMSAPVQPNPETWFVRFQSRGADLPYPDMYRSGQSLPGAGYPDARAAYEAAREALTPPVAPGMEE